MAFLPKLSFAAFVMIPSVALGQGGEATLKQAQTTFDVLDANKDAKLSPQEMLLLKITATDARGIDFDQDGSISKDEFVMFYRQRLVAAGVRPAADLEAEAVRILAARRAKESNRNDGQGGLSQARRNALRTEQQRAATTETGAHDNLLDAFDQMQAKAILGQATKQDFDHVREALAARAQESDRAVKGGDPQSGEASEVHRKLLQSLDRLQTAAAAGKFSREEYQAVRESFLQRARQAAGGASTTQPNPGEPLPNPTTESIEKGLTDALDRLEQRAAAGGATREDFQRVRDQLIARARAAASDPNSAQADMQGTLQRKLIQSLDRLELAAQQGVYSREQYNELRDSMIHRARASVGAAQTQDPSPASTNGGGVSLQSAFDELERRVNAGTVAHEDFKRLQDQLLVKVQSARPADAATVSSESDALAYRRLMEALGRLENAAQNGNVDRAEFQAFKDSFIKRARAIAHEAQEAAAVPRGSVSSSTTGSTLGDSGGASGGNAGDTKPVAGGDSRVKREDPAQSTGSKGAGSDGATSGTQPTPQRPRPAPSPAPSPDKPKPSRPPTQGGAGDKPLDRDHPQRV